MSMIGRQIKKYRTEKGYTQEKLGQMVGVTTQAISKWERGSTPDVEIIPRIAQSLDISIDTLYGRTEETMAVELAQTLCRLPKDEAYRYAFEMCWAMQVGLLGDASAIELFVNRGFTESEKATNHFAKLIHDDGLTFSRLSPLPKLFFLMAEPKDSVLSHLESLDSLRIVFELFADIDVLRIVCYIYSLPFMPVAASLIAKHTGLAEDKVESYMERICDLHLAERTVIATADGEMNSYTVRPEGFAVPLLCFADEIAKDIHPFFGTHDRKKPFFNSPLNQRPERCTKN